MATVAAVINTQSDMCVYTEYGDGSSGNYYTVCTVSDMCVHTEYGDGGRTRKIKIIWTAMNVACNFGYACHNFLLPA